MNLIDFSCRENVEACNNVFNCSFNDFGIFIQLFSLIVIENLVTKHSYSIVKIFDLLDNG